MEVRILGSAAGGGVPQWNCSCRQCSEARRAAGRVQPRTQCSVAVSADGESWLLLDCSPDVRAQLTQLPESGVRGDGARGTALRACLLSDAEIDHTAGLLSLREGERLDVYATEAVRRWLTEDLAISPVLTRFTEVAWHTMPLEREFQPAPGLRARAVATGDLGPRYLPDAHRRREGAVVALVLYDERTCGTLVYAPSVQGPVPGLVDVAPDADCLLLDGTFWSEDELGQVRQGAANAREMGHWPVDGPDGSLAWLTSLPVRHRLYVHVNNTNPMLLEDGEARARLDAIGVRVALDGERIHL